MNPDMNEEARKRSLMELMRLMDDQMVKGKPNLIIEIKTGDGAEIEEDPTDSQDDTDEIQYDEMGRPIKKKKDIFQQNAY